MAQRFLWTGPAGLRQGAILAAIVAGTWLGSAQTPVKPAAATPAKPAAQNPATPAKTPAAPAASAPKSSTTLAGQATPPPPPPAPIPSPQPPFPNIPAAQLAWSVVIDAHPPTPLLPDTDADRLRHAVIAGDRAVTLFTARPESSKGGQPFTIYRLASIELTTGKILAQRDLPGKIRPALWATDDAHLLLQQATLTRLNPDLTESGEHFGDAAKTAGRRGFLLSPDGSVAAYALDGVTDFLDAHTLQPAGLRLKAPEPGAVSKNMLLSIAPIWTSQFPHDTTFIALYGFRSPYLLYHGPCAGHPVFLDEAHILTVACARVTIFDLNGQTIKQLPLGAAFGAFAGVSRDGSRFAIESSDYSVTDPSFNATELFTIYDAKSFEPVATVTPDALPDSRSWAAFAQDGKSFLAGSPKRVSLYKIP